MVIALLFIACYLTSYASLFPDEVAYKIFLERYFLNGGLKETVTPYCESEFLLPPGLLLIPAAAIWSLVTKLGTAYFSFRFLSYLGLFIIFVVLAVINLRKGKHNFWPLLLLITFGPVLYGITLFRPEIVILTCSVILCGLGHSMLNDTKPWPVIIKSLFALLIFDLCLYIHPRAVYMCLIMVGLICIGVMKHIGRNQKIAYGGICAVIMVVMLGQALDLTSKQFMQCHSSLPEIQTYFSDLMQTHAANPMDLINNPARFFKNLAATVSEPSLQKALNGISYQTIYQDNFLPRKDSLSEWDKSANMMTLAVIFGYFGYIIYKLFNCFSCLKDKAEKTRLVFVSLVIISLLVPICFSIVKQFYEISFLVFALMVSATLLYSFSVPEVYPKTGKLTAIIHSILCIALMGGSIICCTLSYNNFTTGFKKGFVGPGVGYNTDWEALNMSIPQALLNASIAKDEPMFVDDLSYGELRNHPLVISVSHFSLTAAVLPRAIRYYSVDRGIHYGVMRCKYSPIFEGYNVKFTVLERIPVIIKDPTEILPEANTECLFKLE
ncbi:MAG: hypothetical protein K2Q32_09715 [Alphaproteobacteria bacterium]|nr:hypothetical protein [Alphaproteobacteria bacterium]